MPLGPRRCCGDASKRIRACAARHRRGACRIREARRRGRRGSETQRSNPRTWTNPAVGRRGGRLIAAVAALILRPAPEAPIRKLEIAMPADVVASTVMLSPDGLRIAYRAGDRVVVTDLEKLLSNDVADQSRPSATPCSGRTIRRSSATTTWTANSGSCRPPADRRGLSARSPRPGS